MLSLCILTALGLSAGCGGGGDDDDNNGNNPYTGTYNGAFTLDNGAAGTVAVAVPTRGDVITVSLQLVNGAANSNGSFSGRMNRSTGSFSFGGGQITIPPGTALNNVNIVGQLNQGGTGTFSLTFTAPGGAADSVSGNFSFTPNPTTTTTTGPTTTTSSGCTGASFSGSIAGAGTNAAQGSFILSKGNGYLGTNSQGNSVISGAAITCPGTANGPVRSITFAVASDEAISAGDSFPIGEGDGSNALATYTEATYTSGGTLLTSRSWTATDGDLVIVSVVGNTYSFRLDNVTMVPNPSGVVGGVSPVGNFILSVQGQVSQNTAPPG